MKKSIFLLSFLIIFGVILLQTYSRETQVDYTKKLASSTTTTPYPTISVKTNEDVVTEAVITPSVSKNIEVMSPLTGDHVEKDILVKGNARTNDNIVGIRLWDSNGNVIAETTAEANVPTSGQYGPFEKTLAFNTTDKTGELEIFQYNNVDGSIIETVEIPLTFN